MDTLSRDIFIRILEIISYEGNKEKHADELNTLLDTSMKEAAVQAAKSFFEDYINTVAPTLKPEQNQELMKYLETLKPEDSKEQ